MRFSLELLNFIGDLLLLSLGRDNVRIDLLADAMLRDCVVLQLTGTLVRRGLVRRRDGRRHIVVEHRLLKHRPHARQRKRNTQTAQNLLRFGAIRYAYCEKLFFFFFAFFLTL